jgi:predicted nucleic acid-binding protein
MIVLDTNVLIEILNKGNKMKLIIEIPNEQLFEKIVWLLNAFKSEGLKIISEGKEKLKPLAQSSSQDGLDFSSFKVESFKQIDGLEYQKGIRDEW